MFASTSAEEKLAILRSESRRLLSSIQGYGMLMRSLIEERKPAELPDEFGKWCQSVVKRAEEFQDLIDALTDWKHRTVMRQAQAEREREFNEQQWRQQQAGLPELQQHASFTEAVLQTALNLGLSLDKFQAGEIKQRAFFHPGSFLELFTPERRARIGAQASQRSGHRYVGYVVTLEWLVDKRNMAWKQHEGLTRSLEEAVTVLYRWLVEQRELTAIQHESPWMREGVVHLESL